MGFLMTMTRMDRVAGFLAAAILIAVPASSPLAQTTTAPPLPAAPATPAAPAPAAPAPVAPPATPSTPPLTEPNTGAATPDKQPPDTSISQTMDLPPRPALVVSGKATWDSGFKAITDSFAKLNDALAKNKISGAGHPLAVFTETDDSGFTYSAMVPLGKAPEGTPDLGPDIKLGETPSGKAMRFQHRGAYDDIDSTYEAITAYLDEKGLEAKNMFAEEYLDQVKTPDDSALEVDIYVFLK